MGNKGGTSGDVSAPAKNAVQLVQLIHSDSLVHALCFNLFSSKDVRLPVQLQRAMAAEAEAAREARAKVRNDKRD